MSILINIVLSLVLLIIVLPVIRKHLIKRKIEQEELFQAKVERIVNAYLQNLVKEDP